MAKWITMLGLSILKVLRNVGWGNGSASKHAGSQAWRTEFKHSEPRLVHTHASEVGRSPGFAGQQSASMFSDTLSRGIGQSVEWDTWCHPLSSAHVQTGMCAHTPLHDVHIQHTHTKSKHMDEERLQFVGWLLCIILWMHKQGIEFKKRSSYITERPYERAGAKPWKLNPNSRKQV